jgi:hypothetical protein
VFLSLWVLGIILCVFVYMGSEDYFVCFCLYGFWGLFCVFLSLWVLRIVLYVFVSMGSEDCFVCTKQSSEPIETKTHKTFLRTHRDKSVSMSSEDYFVCFFSLWVLRIALCVFVSMGSGDCFVCFCLYGFWGLFCVFLSIKQSSEPIEKKTHKAILRTHIDKNTKNNPQNP